MHIPADHETLFISCHVDIHVDLEPTLLGIGGAFPHHKDMHLTFVVKHDTCRGLDRKAHPLWK